MQSNITKPDIISFLIKINPSRLILRFIKLKQRKKLLFACTVTYAYTLFFKLNHFAFFHTNQNKNFFTSKVLISFKFCIFYYYSWLKVGCKNFKWKNYLLIKFLVDFLSFSLSKLSTNTLSLLFINYYCIKHTKLNYTISKGILVRKKQSREQFTFQQNFFYINQCLRVSNLNFLLFNFAKNKLFFSNYLTLAKLFYCNFILPFCQTSVFFLKKKNFFDTNFCLFIF